MSGKHRSDSMRFLQECDASLSGVVSAAHPAMHRSDVCMG
jgi:hypothetical protein